MLTSHWRAPETAVLDASESELNQTVIHKNDLFPEEAWKRQYDRLTKDAEMRELEQMPRPISTNDASDDDRSEELTAD